MCWYFNSRVIVNEFYICLLTIGQENHILKKKCRYRRSSLDLLDMSSDRRYALTSQKYHRHLITVLWCSKRNIMTTWQKYHDIPKEVGRHRDNVTHKYHDCLVKQSKYVVVYIILNIIALWHREISNLRVYKVKVNVNDHHSSSHYPYSWTHMGIFRERLISQYVSLTPLIVQTLREDVLFF